MLLIGVEGGATRTTGVVTSEDLQELARGAAGPANVHTVGEEAARRAVSEVLDGLLEGAGVGWGEVAAAALCLAGLRRPADRARWQRLATAIGIACPVLLTHDAAAGLAAGSADGTGVLVISGTGSLVYGRRGDGEEASAGGRGPLLGDEGSGFDIGWRGLRAAARSADGRGEPSTLEHLIPERLGLAALDDVIGWASPFAKHRVATVAPIVFEAAEGGDPTALRIVTEATGELAEAVEVVARRLWPPDGAALPRVVLSGGVFRAQPRFREALAARVATLAPGATCSEPDADGAVGAARLARRWLEGGLKGP